MRKFSFHLVTVLLSALTVQTSGYSAPAEQSASNPVDMHVFQKLSSNSAPTPSTPALTPVENSNPAPRAPAQTVPAPKVSVTEANVPKQSSAPFQAYTGKISKSKVRLRAQPSVEGQIIRELNKGDMLIIIGETDGFFAVQPTPDIKAYIFRTFVLDNVVEGSRVNIRLEPDLDSPIIGQLNAGDKVQGNVSPLNSKWLEISLPSSTHFYVSKDFVEKIGDANMMAKLDKRRVEVNQLLDNAYKKSQSELQKPFDEIKLDDVLLSFNKIVTQYSDFPDQAARAKELAKTVQDTYVEKKITYLENKTKSATDSWQAKNQQLSNDMKAQQERLKDMEQKLNQQAKVATDQASTVKPANDLTSTVTTFVESNQNASPEVTTKMAQWIPFEEAIYKDWLVQHPEGSMDEFYRDQQQGAIVLKGIIEPYNRLVKNKPGDFILINKGNNLPVAFLYSTTVNLQDKVGHEKTIKAVARPNNNFAFPAYYILSIE